MSTVVQNAHCAPITLEKIQCATCAYYRLDEPSGNALDSTGNDRYLEPVGLGPTTSGPGVIQTARGVVNTNNGFVLHGTWEDPTEECFYLQSGRTVWGWFKGDYSSSDTHWLIALSSGPDWQLSIDVSYQYIFSLGLSVLTNCGTGSNGVWLWFPAAGITPTPPTCYQYYFPSANVPSNQWGFVAVWADPMTKEIGLRLNNQTYTVAGSSFIPFNPEVLGGFGLVTFHSLIGTTYVDEWGVANRVLTTEELDFIYDSGNGRRII